jgi:hypothetical protein
MSTIEDLDAEIARLQQEVVAVERAPPSFDERWPQIESELDAAEATFRRVGPGLGSAPPRLPEMIHQQRQALVGMALVVGRKAVVEAERQRVKEQTAGGLSASEKQRRLEQLRGAILRAAAKRELALRAVEGVGEFRPRAVHAELAVFKRADVERLAR